MKKFNEALANDLRIVVKEELCPIIEILKKLNTNEKTDQKQVAKEEFEIVYLPEATAILRCSKWTVLRLEKRGFFTRLNKVPKSPIYFRKSDILNFLSSNDN
ncbi:MAG: hypothetical protein R8N23_03630 [Reichenbachiella sp.]|uniref:helix-turn-helix transcriptional regulator n=1 Tax=Reichenbachiella sp. TaxID=2184521 RepID=UPI0029672DC7|nr:hypothetical protein [Reichenbachiella sp.]MDW3208929.1 hypothetical protein [Reichenbachiella sp.]